MAEGGNKVVGTMNIHDVSKQFVSADGQEVTALSNVQLDIEPGAFISLIGPSGCGKSTLLMLIAGLQQSDSGTLLLDGEQITKPSFERGLVFQDPTLFPWLNVYDNIAFALKVRKIYHQKKNDITDLIRIIGLEGFEKSYPHQLSGGMRQRVSLARALVGHPKVLLLDEPFGALDAFTRMNMQDELLRIWKENNMTMIMVTHDVDEAIYLSDRVVAMTPRPGRVERMIDIKLPRPRARGSEDFLKYRAKLLQVLDFAGSTQEPDYYL